MPLTITPVSPHFTEGVPMAFTVVAAAGDEEALRRPLSWVILDAHGNVADYGDFERASGNVPPTEPEEEGSRGFTVFAFADALFEGTEGYTFQVRSGGTDGDPLSGALEASLDLALEDGDTPPAWSICDAEPVAEGGELVFEVYAFAASAEEQTVWYSVDGGEPQALVIPAYATAAEIRVQTSDDGERADHPFVTVELLGASLGTASGTAKGFVDDDEHVSAYTVSGGSAVEGGRLAFTVTRTGRADAETITYGLGGTASAGIDHAATSGSVTFEAGELAKTILVQTYLDAALEPAERVSLTLESASAGGVFEVASAAATIADLALPGMLRRQVEVETGPDGNVQSGTGALRFADGWLAFDGGADLGSAFRLYEAALGRAPDAIGLGFWTAALDEGALSLPEIAGFFVACPEFQDRFGVPGNGDFVDLLYGHVLGREADAEGSAFWTAKLDTGALTRAEVTLCFSESAELKAATAPRFAAGVWAPDPAAVDAMRFYETAFDRLPDADGLSFWIGARHGGLTPSQMAEAFTGSAEFAARYGAPSNEGFVERLYLNALDRPADAEGLAHWADCLDSGDLSRAEVARCFAYSLEMTTKLMPYAEDGCVFV